jgi:putative tryptophan/tyrosine transport system substrate-binding protein
MTQIGLLTQATTTDDPNVWDLYITTFTNALCTNGIAKPFLSQTGVDYATYVTGATNLIASGAKVIVTAGNVAAEACYDYTQTQANPTPIVVASAGDLTGLAGGTNLTGCTNGQQDLTILKSRIGKISLLNSTPVVGIVGNSSAPPVNWAMNQASRLIPGAHSVAFTQQSDFQDIKTIQNKLSQLPANVNVLFVCSDPLMRTYGSDFVKAAKTHPTMKLKTLHEFGEWVNEHKGDLSYGPDFNKLFQRAAGYVDQILNGASPANLPVFAPQDPVDCVQVPPPS